MIVNYNSSAHVKATIMCYAGEPQVNGKYFCVHSLIQCAYNGCLLCEEISSICHERYLILLFAKHD